MKYAAVADPDLAKTSADKLWWKSLFTDAAETEFSAQHPPAACVYIVFRLDLWGVVSLIHARVYLLSRVYTPSNRHPRLTV